MKSQRKGDHELGVRLGSSGASREEITRARRELLKLERDRTKGIKSNARELKSMHARYQEDFAALIGASGTRQLNQLHRNRSTTQRAQRIRRIDSLLQEKKVDPTKLRRLQRTYSESAKALFTHGDRVPITPPVFPPCDTPWVTYRPPYSGYFWSYNWNRSSNTSIPELARYLDTNTGRIGSSIKTRLSGADNQDGVAADYYTGLNVWHTAQVSGPIEAYLVFEFTKSNYSGKVKDEFGISSAFWHQWAGAKFSAIQSDIQNEVLESRIIGLTGNDYGDGTSWDEYAASEGDIHSLHFKTVTNFDQGASVLLEAAIDTVTWFQSDDESITTTLDVDLRLDRIMVRSCPPIFF